ncbi:hypothetical protein ACIQXI_07645 [Lysinibacillus sp. NPDC097195]|uniref:hypothetical protein n=1 Tax=Lysinibacillus sp. NPDC097195 TaxID=3364141 RepID=UPI0037F49570
MINKNEELVTENNELDAEINDSEPSNQSASDEIDPLAVPNENYYPGTSTIISIGDVLYSSKSFVTSTKIVGHVAIVGPDYRIYHVNPKGDVAGKRDTLTEYRNRHDPGETIYAYRPSKGATGAANWASNNYSSAITYDIVNLNALSSISPNYCSKFIWQAFYYGSSIDITHLALTGSSVAWVTPGHIKNSSTLTYLTSFSSR